MKQEKQQALAFLEVLDALVDGLESGATNFAEVRADITQLRADQEEVNEFDGKPEQR